MELRDINAEQQITDPELEAVAARIRPLPASIVPSERFLRQMRRHLLQLTTHTGPAAKAA